MLYYFNFALPIKIGDFLYVIKHGEVKRGVLKEIILADTIEENYCDTCAITQNMRLKLAMDDNEGDYEISYGHGGKTWFREPEAAHKMNLIFNCLLKYKGKKESDFEHLTDISHYCNNYYKTNEGDILYAHSDDDAYTAWYICDANDPTNWVKQVLFGESHLSFYGTEDDDVIDECVEGYIV